MGKTALAAALALIGFAGNSILCRLALRGGEIDAATFTGVRLATGALALWLLARRPGGSWLSALALFVYAAPFSFAYLRLGAGVGAFILFASVQATMLGAAIAGGERPGPRVWLGLAIAVGGLVALTLPGAAAPDPLGSALMIVAGVAWGIYSLRGRGVADPLAATAGNFARSLPFAALLAGGALAAHAPLHASPRGLALAAASGALASGVGYSLWYAALRVLRATTAAVLQLVVPVLAAAAAVVLLGEPLTLRLVLSGVAITAGVALALKSRSM
jgi:drug/metabolite transporter (DMT)-like permease